jgi:cyclopropane fatty-acyl-phospholipid synthase-like methyltransferase
MEPFIAAMHRVGLENAQPLVTAVGADGVKRLLDVGGGSGIYSISFARANPDLKAEILDLPEVVNMAERYIREASLSERVTARPGDLRRDELGRNYDLILLSAICHMLSPDENRDLFIRCHRALAPKGRMAVRDFILEPDKTAPRMAALFALNMLVGTPGGSNYNQAEYTSWLRDAGFNEVQRIADDLLVASV